MRRAWYAGHLDATAAGEKPEAARILAEGEARRAGAAWTRQRRRRQLAEAILALERCGAAGARRTPACEQRPPRSARPARPIGGKYARWLERQRDPDVRARRQDISARDRAIALGQPLPRQMAPPKHVTHEEAQRIWRQTMIDARRAYIEEQRDKHERARNARPSPWGFRP